MLRVRVAVVVRDSKATKGMFPALLKFWRGRRGMSQLDLAHAAEGSARHISFLETGRAQPSDAMVLCLAATLNIPLRDQNEMLRAAGFEPYYEESGASDGISATAHQVLERMLAQQEPFPLVVMDRHYDIVRLNRGAERMLAKLIADPSALGDAVNVMHALFEPRLVRPFVCDWEHVAHGLLARLHREALHNPHDTALMQLVSDLCAYPDVPKSWRQPDFSVPIDPHFAVKLKRDDLELAFLTTVTAFSQPGTVALDELRIESYFPLDDATERACRQLAS